MRTGSSTPGTSAGSMPRDSCSSRTARRTSSSTSGGKNIAPQPIENRLKTGAFIAEVVMVGNNRHFPAALVVPKFEALEKWAHAKGMVFASREELVTSPGVVQHYEQEIERLSHDLAPFERIKKVALLPRELSIENGELTPKLRRQAPGGGTEVQAPHRRALRGRMKTEIRKVVVLGAGTMGAQVAAHVLAQGLEVALLDIPGAGEDRSAPAKKGKEALRKLKPSPLHLPEHLAQLRAGNLEDDLARELKDADWVFEAVVEDLEVKKQLFAKVAGLVKARPSSPRTPPASASRR